MSQTATSDGGTERETTRFTDDLRLDEAIEGDRIAPELIPRSQKIEVGERVSRHVAQPADPEDPDDREYTVRLIAHGSDRYDDVQDALVYDPEAELFARLSGHTSSGAWSQKERDWKVRDVGHEVVVEEAWDIEVPDLDDFGQTPEEFVDEWADILFDNAAYGDDVSHELEAFDGKTATLRDFDNRRANIRYSLE